MEERLVNQETIDGEQEEILSLRPESLNEYIGQKDLKRNLHVFLEAAKQRDEVVDHILLYGPPGLGKTTLATIIANEMGTNIQTITGPSIEKAGDLASVLSSLNVGDVLFIDEIHRIPRHVEEILYSAMEDFHIDIMIGATDSTTRSVRLDLPPFTLVGATTKAGMLSNPLRDRFGIVEHLTFYKEEELQEIITRSALVFNIDIEKQGSLEIARRSRGTPRIANRLLKRVRDFSQYEGESIISSTMADIALSHLNIDNKGLDPIDKSYLLMIMDGFNGGPVGLETICSAIGEEKETIEYMVEPFLLQSNLIQRTPRGRMVTQEAYRHFGKQLVTS